MRSRLSEMTSARYATYAGALDDPVYANRSRSGHGRSQNKARRQLERVLDIGNWLFQSVRLIEANWRNEVLSRETNYDRDEDASIQSFYWQWSKPCKKCLAEITAFEQRGVRVRGAVTFRKNCELANSVL